MDGIEILQAILYESGSSWRVNDILIHLSKICLLASSTPQHIYPGPASIETDPKGPLAMAVVTFFKYSILFSRN